MLEAVIGAVGGAFTSTIAALWYLSAWKTRMELTVNAIDARTKDLPVTLTKLESKTETLAERAASDKEWFKEALATAVGSLRSEMAAGFARVEALLDRGGRDG